MRDEIGTTISDAESTLEEGHTLLRTIKRDFSDGKLSLKEALELALIAARFTGHVAMLGTKLASELGHGRG